jgi:DNA-binding PadR family transcriptional regulator
MKPQKEVIGASTHLLILSVLAEQASYGYQIIKRINDEADGYFAWQEGTVYPLLHKLEKDGFVRTQWQQADTGRRRKCYYITAAGREALETGTRDWTRFHLLITRLAPEINPQ